MSCGNVGVVVVREVLIVGAGDGPRPCRANETTSAVHCSPSLGQGLEGAFKAG
ncbi:hypothetical protein [Pseudonocardia sp. TMWB2A]|uniref:hypothetical protein n=1 Tax=Pseudonocardia sp. TMWB2A TaxID=687430 RepID=UPI00307D44E3